jgi:hypothetical protein
VADSEAVRSHDTCTECGMPIEDALTPMGASFWQHTTVRIGPGDENVPGTWTSDGTHWVPDHIASGPEETT